MVVFLAWVAPCFADTYSSNFDATSANADWIVFLHGRIGLLGPLITVSGIQFDFTLSNTNFLYRCNWAILHNTFSI